MKYGLIAEKVGHSFSAEIHNKLFGYTYELVEISKENFDQFMKQRDFEAINVTIPYKEAVIPHLDYVDQTALEIGAVNTVVNREGKLYGYNTDLSGLIGLIKRSGIKIENKKVLILGSGGTSKTAYYAVKHLKCAEVYRVSRNEREGYITYPQAVSECFDADVIINTTPLGMYPGIGKSAIELDAFHNLSGVVDVVYNPLNTKLVTDAKMLGIKAVGGLYLLVAQAAYAAEHFVGKSASPERIEEIYKELYKKKQNIVLIGMPASGKTTVGNRLAELLGRTFTDTDEVICSTTGRTPAEIINQDGEAKFRDIETEVIKNVALSSNAVIATGGGAILREENISLLLENGRIYFLDRSPEHLPVTSDRPLSTTREALMARYKERYPIYLSSCDKRIDCVFGIDPNVNAILEDFNNEDTCN